MLEVPDQIQRTERRTVSNSNMDVAWAGSFPACLANIDIAHMGHQPSGRVNVHCCVFF